MILSRFPNNSYLSNLLKTVPNPSKRVCGDLSEARLKDINGQILKLTNECLH